MWRQARWGFSVRPLVLRPLVLWALVVSISRRLLLEGFHPTKQLRVEVAVTDPFLAVARGGEAEECRLQRPFAALPRRPDDLISSGEDCDGARAVRIYGGAAMRPRPQPSPYEPLLAPRLVACALYLHAPHTLRLQPLICAEHLVTSTPAQMKTST